LKVFDDNAGVVRVDDDSVFVWKVETHNSPSAIDRTVAPSRDPRLQPDPLGTGRGGGRLLFNTDVLCFAPPIYERPLLPGSWRRGGCSPACAPGLKTVGTSRASRR